MAYIETSLIINAEFNRKFRRPNGDLETLIAQIELAGQPSGIGRLRRRFQKPTPAERRKVLENAPYPSAWRPFWKAWETNGPLRDFLHEEVAAIAKTAATVASGDHSALSQIVPLGVLFADFNHAGTGEAWRTLTLDDALEIIHFAHEHAVIEGPGYPSLPARLAVGVACSVPEALDGWHRRFLDWPLPDEHLDAIVFRNADTFTRDQLLQRQIARHIYARKPIQELIKQLEQDFEQGLRKARTISVSTELALVWIGDEVICRAMQPKPGEGVPVIPPDAARGAGWELTPDGRRLDLTFPAAFALRSEADVARSVGPVRALVPRPEHCCVCGGTVVDVFDIDLTDPRMGFIGLPGLRLRIQTCVDCHKKGGTPQSGRFDDEGGFQPLYSPTGSGPAIQPKDRGMFALTSILVLGHAYRLPWSGHWIAYLEVASRLGGHPRWDQDPDYPVCPTCNRTMVFLGQASLEDIGAGGGDIYACICSDCRIATTVFQFG